MTQTVNQVGGSFSSMSQKAQSSFSEMVFGTAEVSKEMKQLEQAQASLARSMEQEESLIRSLAQVQNDLQAAMEGTESQLAAIYELELKQTKALQVEKAALTELAEAQARLNQAKSDEVLRPGLEEDAAKAKEKAAEATGKLAIAQAKLNGAREKMDTRVERLLEKEAETTAKLSQAKTKVAADSQKVEKANQGLSSSTNLLGESFSTAGKKLLGFGGMVGAVLMGLKLLKDGVVKAFESIVGYGSKMQAVTGSFQGIFEGNGDAAKLFTQQLEELSARSGEMLEFEKLADASKELLNLGIAGDQVIPILTSVGDAAAATGKGAAGFDKILNSLTRIQGAGKVTLDSMNGLVRDGIPAWTMLAQAMGKSEAEVQKLARQGKISAEEGISAIVGGLQGKWAGSMDQFSKDWNNMWGRIGKNTDAILGAIGAPIFDWMNGLVSRLDDTVAQFKRTLENGGLGEALKELLPDSSYFAAFIDLFSTMAEKFGPALSKIGSVLGKIGSIAVQVGGQLLEVFTPIVKAVDLVIGVLGDLANVCWGIVNDLLDVWEPFAAYTSQKWTDLKEGVVGILTEIAEYCSEIGSEIVTILGNAGSWAMDAFCEAFPGMTSFVAGIWEELKVAVWGKVKEFVRGVLEFLSPITNWIGLKFEEYTSKNDGSTLDLENAKKGIAAKTGSSFKGAPSGKGGGGANKAEKAIYSIQKKIRDLIEKMDDKIFDELAPSYENSFRKLDAEVVKWMTDLQEQMKINKVTVDLTELEAKAKQYKEVLIEPIQRAWKNAWADIKNDTAKAWADMIGDKKKQSELQYEMAREALEREKRERFKAIAQHQEDAEAKLAVDQWYDAENAKLLKEKRSRDRENYLSEMETLLALNETKYELEGKSVQEIKKLNKGLLEEKLRYLDLELRQEGLTNEEILKLRQQRIEAQKALETMGSNGTSFQAGLQSQLKEWSDWGEQVKAIGSATAQGMNDSFSDLFFDAMNGQLKSLGDYFTRFLQSITKAIAQAMSNRIVSGLIGNLFGGMGGGGSTAGTGPKVGSSLGSFLSGIQPRAVGGPVSSRPYLVGENGPELFTPQSQGRITNTDSLKNMLSGNGGGSGNVQVNITNQGSGEMELSQSDVKYDEKMEKWIVNVVAKNASKNRSFQGILAGAARTGGG